MLVEFGSVAEFFEELGGEKVFRDVVRLDVIRQPMQEEAVTYGLAIVLTAVICTGEGDYLCAYASSEPKIVDASQAFVEQADGEQEARQLAEELGLRVKPGRYSLEEGK